MSQYEICFAACLQKKICLQFHVVLNPFYDTFMSCTSSEALLLKSTIKLDISETDVCGYTNCVCFIIHLQKENVIVQMLRRK